MDIFSYGVTASRYEATLTLNEDTILIPVSSNIHVWSIKAQKRERVLNYNSNAISKITRNKSHIFSVCYNGEVAVLNKDTLEKVKVFPTKARTVKHVSLTDDYLLIVGDKGSNHGYSEVFSISDLDNLKENELPKTILSLEDRFRFGHIVRDKLYILKENVLNKEEREAWNALKKENPTLSKQDKPKKRRNYDAHLFDLKNTNNVKTLHLDHEGAVLSSYANGENLICTLYTDRFFFALDTDKFEVLASTKFVGNGAILSGAIFNQFFYLCPKNDTLLKIRCDALKNLKETFDYENEKNEAIDVMSCKFSGLGPKNTCINWVKLDQVLAIHFDGEMNIVDFVNNKVSKHHYFEISSCGLALSNNGKMAAGGDLAGNVFVYPVEKCIDMEPLYRVNVIESVRTLVFDSRDQSILIGTLGFKLFRWYLNEPEAKLVTCFENAVLNLRYNNFKEEGDFLIVGLASGMMAVFKEIRDETHMQLKFGYYAHEPIDIPNNVNFGSLHRHAEIWSTIWAPNSNDKVVTCSEDQTCLVWDISKRNPKLLHKLEGHKLAVTSVDWKIMDPRIGEIFISCSDDQTARIYDPNDNFKLIDVISTSFIREWHTLTYLALEKGGTRLAIGAQNGFLFIYDLITKTFTYSHRLHQGSIEGLDWKNNTLVTCAADNCIDIIFMNS